MEIEGYTETEVDELYSVEHLFNSINERVQELYERSNRKFTPTYPNVFCMVLEREQKIGSIWTPDTSQNKPMHEGIVIATWKPFMQERGSVDDEGNVITRVVMRKSALTPGQHVLFHHSAGYPAWGFNPKKYRTVKEEGWVNEDHGGGIVAVVEYDEPNTSPRAVLYQIIHEFITSGEAEDWHFNAQYEHDMLEELLIHKVEDKLLLIDKKQQSVTLSGK
jgi:hypothetical protein